MHKARGARTAFTVCRCLDHGRRLVRGCQVHAAGWTDRQPAFPRERQVTRKSCAFGVTCGPAALADPRPDFSSGGMPARPCRCRSCLLAALIVFDGLVGPQLAPKNLATVGVWLHYRGLVVLALLVAGNLFCMACPFMLPRQAARWLRERLGRRPNVPALLRNKWLAVGLVVAFLLLLRELRPVGEPVVDGLGRPRLFPGGVRGGYHLSAARPSASMFVRWASSTSSARWSRRWRSRCGKRPCAPRAGRRIASRRSSSELGRVFDRNRRRGVRDRPKPRTFNVNTSSVRANCRSSGSHSPSAVRGCELCALPAPQGRQHGLHLLPGLRPRLPV